MSTVNRITSLYKISSSFTEVSLPSSAGSFLEIASVDTFGILYKSMIKFDNKKIIVRCVIDGEQIFEVDLEDLKDMSGNGHNDGYFNVSLCPLIFNDPEDLFIFNPAYPIMFRQHVKFYAKSSSSSTSRDMESYLIEYTEE